MYTHIPHLHCDVRIFVCLLSCLLTFCLHVIKIICVIAKIAIVPLSNRKYIPRCTIYFNKHENKQQSDRKLRWFGRGKKVINDEMYTIYNKYIIAEEKHLKITKRNIKISQKIKTLESNHWTLTLIWVPESENTRRLKTNDVWRPLNMMNVRYWRVFQRETLIGK